MVTGPEDDPLSSNTIPEELNDTQSDIQRIPTHELERSIAEIKNDINFLEDQVSSDLGSYSPIALEKAKLRIQLVKRKAEIMIGEYEKREK
jgi:hypothetical protein